MNLGSGKHALLITLALSALLIMVVVSWDETAAMIRSADWSLLSLSLLFLALSNLSAGIILAAIVKNGDDALATSQVVGAFLLAQASKYVPGKIWPILMQSALHQKGVAGRIISGNIELIGLQLLLISCVGLIAVAYLYLGLAFATAIFICSCFFTCRVASWGVASRLIGKILQTMPRLAKWRGLHAFASAPGQASSFCSQGCLGIAVFMVAYGAGWWLFVVACVTPEPMTALAVTGIIALSHIGAALSLLPGGLGAREGVIIILAPAAGISLPEMTAIALASRAAIIVVDVLSAATGAIFIRNGANRKIARDA